MNFSPIVLFVFNRVWHTQQTIEALKKNNESVESKLIVFSDGPKDKESAVQVKELREYLATVDGFKSVRIVEREKNLGLAASIISGVTEVLEKSGSAIVLEDDLIVSPFFLNYMNRALERYKDDDLVMQVSGYMFPVCFSASEDALFLPFTTSWGWATWRKAWDKFDTAASGFKLLQNDKVKRDKFDLNGAYPYFKMLERQMKGEIDSWAIRWYLSVFLQGGLVLYPNNSLVTNIGFDGSGKHCGSDNQHQCIHDWEKDTGFPVTSFPSEQKVADQFELITDYLRQDNSSKLTKMIFKILLKIQGALSRLMSSLNAYKCEQGCISDKSTVFYQSAKIVNGQNKAGLITLGKDCHVRGELLTFGHGGQISVGSYCYIGSNTHIWSAKKITVGNRVLISHDVNIFDNATHPLNTNQRHIQYLDIISNTPSVNIDLNEKSVTIEDDVLIGCASIILKGVTVGKGSIIGAGSVVTKDIPAWSVVAGNPAEVIRSIPESER